MLRQSVYIKPYTTGKAQTTMAPPITTLQRSIRASHFLQAMTLQEKISGRYVPFLPICVLYQNLISCEQAGVITLEMIGFQIPVKNIGNYYYYYYIFSS